MQINAHAKINWMLSVKGLLPGGYHELDMLMQRISLHDTLTLENADTLSLTLEKSEVGALSVGEDNLILRAARALAEEAGIVRGAAIRLIKRIPMQAGLGGGSVDAAAVLSALNTLWDIHFSNDRLCAIGAKLGADIPYCLTGGLCRVRGFGEKIKRLSGAKEYPLLLVMPGSGVSTKDVFALCGNGKAQQPEDAAQFLREGRLSDFALSTANDLEAPACSLRPAIRKCLEDMRFLGASFARMSGSGSAVFGIFPPAREEEALRALSARYPLAMRVHTICS